MDDFEQRLNQILNNPEAMAQISELASGLNMTGETASQENVGASIPEEGMLKAIGPLLSQMQANSGREDEILHAIRPHVGESTKKKVDRAIHAAKISRLAGFAWKTMEKQLGVEPEHGK